MVGSSIMIPPSQKRIASALICLTDTCRRWKRYCRKRESRHRNAFRSVTASYANSNQRFGAVRPAELEVSGGAGPIICNGATVQMIRHTTANL